MTVFVRRILFTLSLVLLPLAAIAESWPEELKSEHWPGTYWWVPGSAMDEENIAFNLRQMHDVGIRNAHMIPIYGAKGAEDRYIDYLSPEWMRQLGYAVRTAESLDMNLDMTTGTGWCFGGPDLGEGNEDVSVRWSKVKQRVELRVGRQVKRAAPGSEGMMINPFSPEAMTTYLQRFSAAFEEHPVGLPRAQYHDSFEYKGNWSTGLLDAFKAKRGYDLVPHLPTMFEVGADPTEVGRLKYDYRLTLAELHYDAMQVWVDWCHERGMLTRNEAHGSPANLIDVYAQCDIPETEMFGATESVVPGFRLDPAHAREGDVDLRVCMLASSAAHIAHEPGRQLVSSESCTWLRNHWNTTLTHVKLQLDQFFLSGVNHLFYHGTCYSPQDAAWPGWYFYAAVKFDRSNAFWRDFGHLNHYVARCQSVLQAGRPANDVLLYWPIHDLWQSPEGLDQPLVVHGPTWMSESNVGDLSQHLLDRGYAFDFISDRLLEGINSDDGKLHAVGGDYQAIVVPDCDYMPPETMAKLSELAAQGATVIFENHAPTMVPGRVKLAARRTAMARAMVAGLQSVVVSDDVLQALDDAGVQREEMTDAGLRFVRREIGGGHYYFITNHAAIDYDGWLALGKPFASVTEHNPMTGRAGIAASQKQGVYLQLDAGASTVLSLSDEPVEAAARPYFETAGKALPVDGPWEVAFIDGAPALPEARGIKTLTSWTEWGDDVANAFAGTARYTTTFTLPDGADADEWLLGLGDVRESARVRINGKDAGTLVALPMRMRVGAYLVPGANTLEIEVTNLSANRARAFGDSKEAWDNMRDINIVTVDYEDFQPWTWDLLPSGLLGPVRLVPLVEKEVR